MTTSIDQAFPRGNVVDKENPSNIFADPLNKIFYPREYVIDEANLENSYVRGVTFLGNEAVVYLRLKDSDRMAISEDNAKTEPSILDFAETRPNATRKCLASADNSPENPCGVLMIEQVQLMSEPPANHPEGVMIASAHWMSILQEQNYNHASVGMGYVEVAFSPRMDPELRKKIGRYHALHQKFLNPPEDEHVLDLEQQLETLQKEIIGDRKMFLTGVNMKPEQTISINLGNELGVNAKERLEKFKDLLRGPLESMTEKGRYGGAIVRLRRGNDVSGNVFDVINMRYDGQTKGVKPFDEVMTEFAKFGNRDLVKAISTNKSPDTKPVSPITLDIIPCQRTNLGQKSYPRIVNDILKLGSSKLLKTYVDENSHRLVGIEDLNKKGAYIANVLCTRNAEAVKVGRGNVLASSFHSASGPLCNSLLLNQENKQLNLTAPAAAAPAPKRPAQEPVPQ